MNIKYLEYIDYQPGSIFKTDNENITTNIFSAIVLCDKSFDIINPNALGFMPFYNGTIGNSKNYLGRFALIRTIELSDDKSVIDFEYFSLETPTGTIEFVYDYSFMYDESIEEIISNSNVFVNNNIYEAWLYPIASTNTIKCKSRKEYLDQEYIYSNNVYAFYYLDNKFISHKDDVPMYKIIKIK